MTLLVTVFAAIIATVKWYKDAPKGEMKLLHVEHPDKTKTARTRTAGSSSFFIDIFLLYLSANLYDFLHFLKAYDVVCPAPDRSSTAHAFSIFSEFLHAG